MRISGWAFDSHMLAPTFSLVFLSFLVILAAAQPSLKLNISRDEIASQLAHLATFSDDAPPAVTRILFTREAHAIATGLIASIHMCKRCCWCYSNCCRQRRSSSAHPAPRLPRPPPANDMKARTYVKQLMAEAGLKIREDTMGNIYGGQGSREDTMGKLMGG